MSISKITNIVNNFIYLIFLIMIYKKIGPDGAGIFGISAFLVWFMFILLFGGTRTTVSKLVSVRLKRGFNDNAKKVFRYSLVWNFFLAIICAVITVLLANAISGSLFNNNLCGGVLVFLSIVLVLGALCETIKGYYIGCGGNILYTISEIAKDIILLVATPFVIDALMAYGGKVAALKNDILITGVYGAIGAVLTIAACLLINLIILMIGVRGLVKQDSFSFNEVRSKDGLITFLRSYIPAAVRKVRDNIFTVLPIIFSIIIYMRVNNEKAVEDILAEISCILVLVFAYYYLNKNIFDEYNVIQYTKVRIDYKKEDRKGVLSKYNAFAKSILVMVIPVFVTFIAFSGFICNKLFTFSVDSATKVATILSFVILLTILDGVFQTGLSAVNLDITTFLGNSIAFVFEVIFVLAISKKGFSITNIVTALLLFYLISTIFHGIFAVKNIGFKYNDLLAKFIKVLIAGLPMLIVDILLSKFFSANIILALVFMALGYLIFAIIFIIIRGMNQKDINNMQGSISYYIYSILGSVFHVR